MLSQWSQNVSVVQIEDAHRYLEIHWEKYPWLNIYIRSLQTNRKNEHLKERKKNAYFCQSHTKKNKLYK